MTDKKNFWQTAPGIITGLATILTALVALVPLLTGGDDSDNAEPQSTQSATPTPTSSSSPTSGNSGSSSSGNVGPRAVIAPKSLNFGEIGSGKTASQTVTVANTGNEYLVVDSASIDGRSDVFSVQAQECLDKETGIAPDDECDVTVSFNPTSPGAFASFLDIEHSGKDSPTRVALNGEGRLIDL